MRKGFNPNRQKMPRKIKFKKFELEWWDLIWKKYKMMEIPTWVRLFTSIIARRPDWCLDPKKVFQRSNPVGGIPTDRGPKVQKKEINFSRKKALAAVCPDSFVGCDWLLTIHGGCGWRRHRGALSLRGSNAGIWTDLHGPLRDENSQWDWDTGSGTRIEYRIRFKDWVQGLGYKIRYKDWVQGYNIQSTRTRYRDLDETACPTWEMRIGNTIWEQKWGTGKV